MVNEFFGETLEQIANLISQIVFYHQGFPRIIRILQTCHSFSTTEDSHVTIITNEHELAADAHVDATESHYGTWHDAPYHQEEQSSTKI